MSEDEELALVDALAEALEQMREKTCQEMVPLWLEQTRVARQRNLRSQQVGSLETASARYKQLGKASRSKYRALAVWRHSVLWLQLLPKIEKSRFREAVDSMYFTPWPDNSPPYAWSKAAGPAEDVERLGGPSAFKDKAKRGVEKTLQQLEILQEQWNANGDWLMLAKRELTKAATGGGARDVLKLKPSPKKKESQ